MNGLCSIEEIAKKNDFILLDNSVISTPFHWNNSKSNVEVKKECCSYWINVLKYGIDLEKIRTNRNACKEIVGPRYSSINVLRNIQKSKKNIRDFLINNNRVMFQKDLGLYLEAKEDVMSCVEFVDRALKRRGKFKLSDVDIEHLIYSFALAKEERNSAVLSNDTGMLWLWNNVSYKSDNVGKVDFYSHITLGSFEKRLVRPHPRTLYN